MEQAAIRNQEILAKGSSKVTGFILGYKVFQLRDDFNQLSLASPTTRVSWPHTQQRALCGQHPEPLFPAYLGALEKLKGHNPPAANCGCGLYAFYSLKNLLDSGYEYDLRQSNFVVALVKGWGKTKLHGEGFRSKYMEIVAILKDQHPTMLESENKRIEILAANYGIPALNAQGLKVIVAELGGEFQPKPTQVQKKVAKPNSKFLQVIKKKWQPYAPMPGEAWIPITVTIIMTLLLAVFAIFIYSSVRNYQPPPGPVALSNVTVNPSGSTLTNPTTVSFTVTNNSKLSLNLMLQNDANASSNYLQENRIMPQSSCQKTSETTLSCGILKAKQSKNIHLVGVLQDFGSFSYSLDVMDGSNTQVVDISQNYLTLNFKQVAAK